MEQKCTSKMTCQNFGKPNAAYKYIPNNTKMLLDYGCGKYKNNEIYCMDKNIEWFGYDPYWKSEQENEQCLAYIKNNKMLLDCVICSNVLNVIDSEYIINEILEFLVSLGNDNTTYVFSCYRGNGSNIGKVTKKDCWQRNEKKEIWEKRLKKYFDIVLSKNDIFVCKKSLLGVK